MTTVEVDRALIERAERALWEMTKAALTVKPTLDVAYPDDPRWTPWTRWMEREAHEAYDACMALRKALRAGGDDVTTERTES